jgi:hypothetical protein
VITITIQTDNDAFQGDAGAHEVARILRDVADRFAGGDVPNGMRLRDANGNTVGDVEYDDESED